MAFRTVTCRQNICIFGWCGSSGSRSPAWWWGFAWLPVGKVLPSLVGVAVGGAGPQGPGCMMMAFCLVTFMTMTFCLATCMMMAFCLVTCRQSTCISGWCDSRRSRSPGTRPGVWRSLPRPPGYSQSGREEMSDSEDRGDHFGHIVFIFWTVFGSSGDIWIYCIGQYIRRRIFWNYSSHCLSLEILKYTNVVKVQT